MSLTIHVDGGSRGNPGPAGAGVVIRVDDGPLLHEAGYFLGTQTNNAAEYHALIRALQRVARLAPQPIAVLSDSELLVRQITGAYQVRNAKLLELFEQAQLLLLKVRCWRMQHVRREHNRRADELANLAMDEQRDVIVLDADEASATSANAPNLSPDAPASTDAAGGAKAATGQSPAEPLVPAAREPRPGKKSGREADAAEVEAELDRAAPADSPRRTVHVAVATAPPAGVCPAGGIEPTEFNVDCRVPGGLCLHAAHAILPTLLAIQNTDAREFSAVPTLTVRCSRNGCPARFLLSPVRGHNGTGHLP